MKGIILFASLFGFALCAPKNLISSGPKGIVSTAFGTFNGSMSAVADFMHREMEPRMKRIEASIGDIGAQMDHSFTNLREQMMGLAGVMPGNKLPGDLVFDVKPDSDGEGGATDVSSSDDSPRVMQMIPIDNQNPIGGLFTMIGNVPKTFQSGISKRKRVEGKKYNPDVVILDEEKDSI